MFTDCVSLGRIVALPDKCPWLARKRGCGSWRQVPDGWSATRKL